MKFNIVAQSFVGKIEGYEFMRNKGLIGGAEIYLYDLSNFLRNERHDVTIIQPWHKNEIFDLDGINVKGIKLPKLFKTQVEFSFFWRNYIDIDADVVHLHNFDDAFPFGNNTMTATCHGINWDCPRMGAEFDKTVYERYFPHWKWKYVRFRAHYAIKHLNKIASVDTFLLRYVQAVLPQFRDKIKVIPNYVDTKVFNPGVDGSEIRKEYGNKPTILFPRNISYARGVHLALESIRILSYKYPDILLFITGDGPQKNWAVKYINDNKLQKNVVLIGHRDHFKDMPKIYAAADMVIIPSFCSEGTSLGCLEAMASRKAVVVTNIGGLTDIVIDRYNGLTCKPRAESLAEKLKLLLDDSALRKSMSAKALSWVKERHSYGNWKKAYKEFFEI